MITSSLAENQAIGALALLAVTTGLSTMHLHKAGELLGTISLILPGGTFLKAVTAPTDVAGFGAIGAHPPPVCLALAPVSPLLTSVVLVNAITVTSRVGVGVGSISWIIIVITSLLQLRVGVPVGDSAHVLYLSAEPDVSLVSPSASPRVLNLKELGGVTSHSHGVVRCPSTVLDGENSLLVVAEPSLDLECHSN